MDTSITKFLSAIAKAEVKHKNDQIDIPSLEFTSIKELKTYVYFNGLKDAEYQKHEKQLKKLYDDFCTGLETHVASLYSKQEKLNLLVNLSVSSPFFRTI